ncbi:unnamed protein product [Caenorhabditis angaria]|uniref:Spermatogenesis-associated protein 20-like TRX domain-containing protein n=1 Tax=Caenorhabditis angaria TaxID=860376 RepID=A0A9P1ICT0_9PELO|nr:unnamed protein product [Caenorhabditis angaria]
MNFTRLALKMNRLHLEKSPYLLQHATNPIHWYSWGQEAFQEARLKNLPIFLSVGYSTCHWCHVMEKESFENVEIADFLNENFVSIKVDREERPDVDKLYMEFIVATTGHGGWPMNVFLAPENLAPITGGTYFPPDDSRGMLGFPSILKMISEEWRKDAEGLKNQGKILLELMGKSEVQSAQLPEADRVFEAIYSHKTASFDATFGGFGRAPKFPKCSDLDFLVHYASSQKSESPEKSQNTLKMLKKTLESMIFGGIHDHIGKGFHRYSVDREWHIPHFEKMLYDQAQLLGTFSDFYRLESSPEIRQIIQDIYEYLIENLQHPEGGFYSAEDADSFPFENSPPKKIEGAFATWTKDEITQVLMDEREREIFCEYFDVEDEGNLPKHAEEEMGKLKNCLRRVKTDEEVAGSFGISVEDLQKSIGESKKKLLTARKLRPAPHLDSKIVCSWQGLSISGLVKAYQAIGSEEMLRDAEKCWDFVEKYLIVDGETGELRRAVYLEEDGGEEKRIEMGNSPMAFSDDYAFLIQGLLDLYTVTGKDKYLKAAENLQTKMDLKFWNSSGGYFISAENEELKIRICENQDGAEPCATSIATLNLLRFYEILEVEKYREAAEKCLKWAGERLEKVPIALPKLALAHQRWQNGAQVFVLVGEPDSELLELARTFLNQKFIANSSVVHICEADTLSASGISHSAMLLGPKPAVYICSGFVCGKPIRNLDELRQKFERDY